MKKTFLFVSMLFAGFALNAAYLQWQVDSNAGDGNTAGSFSFDSARIGYYTATEETKGKTLAELEDAGNIIKYDSAVYAADGGLMETSALSNINEGYTYFIELVNYNEANIKHVAYSEALAYSDLAAKGYVSSELPSEGMRLPATWHGGTYNAVPEPTSALMMMLGLAFLGLKRRVA